jgi:plastocyanin
MRVRRTASVLLLAGLAGCGGGSSHGDNSVAPGPVSAPPRTIVFANFAFVPATITARAGAVWTEENDDVATHNISTAAFLKAHPDSSGGNIAPDVDAGEKKTFTMPSKPGTYQVVCFYHQKMTATITITK